MCETSSNVFCCLSGPAVDGRVDQRTLDAMYESFYSLWHFWTPRGDKPAFETLWTNRRTVISDGRVVVEMDIPGLSFRRRMRGLS